MMWKSVTLAILLLTSALAQAEVRYIKDVWNVGLYTAAGGQGESLGLLSSGTALEVLAEEGSYTQVKTSTGEIGWIKSNYLVSEETSDIQLKRAQREIERLKQRIEQLSSDDALAQAQVQIEQLQAEQQEAKAQLAQSQRKVNDLQVQLDPDARKEALVTAISLCLLGLIIGFVFGKRFIEAKVRARFNGLKVW